MNHNEAHDARMSGYVEGWHDGHGVGELTERARIVALLRASVKNKAPRRLSQIDRGWMLALLDHVESTPTSSQREHDPGVTGTNDKGQAMIAPVATTLAKKAARWRG